MYLAEDWAWERKKVIKIGRKKSQIWWLNSRLNKKRSTVFPGVDWKFKVAKSNAKRDFTIAGAPVGAQENSVGNGKWLSRIELVDSHCWGKVPAITAWHWHERQKQYSAVHEEAGYSVAGSTCQLNWSPAETQAVRGYPPSELPE